MELMEDIESAHMGVLETFHWSVHCLIEKFRIAYFAHTCECVCCGQSSSPKQQMRSSMTHDCTRYPIDRPAHRQANGQSSRSTKER
jgi:hypothetical protein